MKLIGFRFTKINVEKISEMPSELKINTNLNILGVEESKADLIRSNNQLIEVEFEYSLIYEPNYAKISFIGRVLLSVDYKLSKEIIKEWKTKNIPIDFKVSLFNLIIRKASIKAFQFEEEMNLPYHLPFPTVGKPKEKTVDGE